MRSTILSFLAALILAVPVYAQKTMVQARTEIRILLSEQTAKFFTDAEIDSAWNRAQIQTALLGGVVKMRDVVFRTFKDSGATRMHYPLGPGVMWIRSALVDSGDRSNLFLTIIDEPEQIPYLGGQTKPTYCVLHDTVLFVYPVPSDTERIRVSAYIQPTDIQSATVVTDLPVILQQVPIWLAASFILPKDYKYEVSKYYHDRAMELVAAYRANFKNQQTQSVRGAAPLPPSGGGQ